MEKLKKTGGDFKGLAEFFHIKGKLL